MSVFNIDGLIKDLPEDIREQARKCQSCEELMELASKEDIELSDDLLEAITCGFVQSDKKETVVCNVCGTAAVTKEVSTGKVMWCEKCDKELESIRDHHIEYR